MDQKPFEESIVDVLEKLDKSFSQYGLSTIGDILLTTRISANHERIVDAWINACRAASQISKETQAEVVRSVLGQK